LAAGADGFVNKAAADTEVLQAVRSIRNGRSYFGMGASERELAWPDPKLGTPAGLSDREREVVRLIALGHTNREVASGFGISIKSVESYRARVMQKLGFGCRADLVRFALETGLIGGREEHPVMMD
jgi:DNA-binding NarL/FixJ family response regulator